MGEIKILVAENLRAICKAKGIKQVDLARALGVAEANVSNWFRGSNSMDIDTLAEICRILGVSLDTVFGRIDEENFYNVAETKLIKSYRQLSPQAQAQLDSYLDFLLHTEKSEEKKEVQII